MTTNVWAKYLPVIRVVLKRSIAAEQQFALNTPDFVRAGFTRKSGYKFLIKIREGHLSHAIADEPVASELASALLTDASLRSLFAEREFHISLNTKYMLTIKHLPLHKTEKETALAAAI